MHTCTHYHHGYFSVLLITHNLFHINTSFFKHNIFIDCLEISHHAPQLQSFPCLPRSALLVTPPTGEGGGRRSRKKEEEEEQEEEVEEEEKEE